jgi:hypothetical protein
VVDQPVNRQIFDTSVETQLAAPQLVGGSSPRSIYPAPSFRAEQLSVLLGEPIARCL